MSMIVRILVIIGGVNWGLVGLGMLLGGNWNVINMILGSMPVFEAIIYILVGISAVMMIFNCRCGKCKDGVCTPSENMDASKTEGSM